MPPAKGVAPVASTPGPSAAVAAGSSAASTSSREKKSAAGKGKGKKARGGGALVLPADRRLPVVASAQYTTTFADEYARNNKANNTKNLRCFPSCSDLGHRYNCFCGNSARVVFQVNVPAE